MSRLTWFVIGFVVIIILLGRLAPGPVTTTQYGNPAPFTGACESDGGVQKAVLNSTVPPTLYMVYCNDGISLLVAP